MLDIVTEIRNVLSKAMIDHKITGGQILKICSEVIDTNTKFSTAREQELKHALYEVFNTKPRKTKYDYFDIFSFAPAICFCFKSSVARERCSQMQKDSLRAYIAGFNSLEKEHQDNLFERFPDLKEIVGLQCRK